MLQIGNLRRTCFALSIGIVISGFFNIKKHNYNNMGLCISITSDIDIGKELNWSTVDLSWGILFTCEGYSNNSFKMCIEKSMDFIRSPQWLILFSNNSFCSDVRCISNYVNWIIIPIYYYIYLIYCVWCILKLYIVYRIHCSNQVWLQQL